MGELDPAIATYELRRLRDRVSIVRHPFPPKYFHLCRAFPCLDGPWVPRSTDNRHKRYSERRRRSNRVPAWLSDFAAIAPAISALRNPDQKLFPDNPQPGRPQQALC